MARIALGFHKHVGPFLYYLVLIVRFMASGQQNATTRTNTEEGVGRSTILAQNGPTSSTTTVHSGISPVNVQDHRRPCGSPDLNCDKDLNGKRVAFPGDCRRFFICAFRFTADTGTAGKWRWTEKGCPGQLSDTPYLFKIYNPLALDGDCVQRRSRTCRQVMVGCVLVPHQGYKTEEVKLPEPSTTTPMSNITTPNLVPAQEEDALAPGVVAGAVIGGVVVTIVLVVLVCRCSRGHSMSSCRRQKKERVKSGGNVDMNDPTYQDSDMLQTPFLKQTLDIHNAQLDEREKDLSQLYSRPIKGDAKRPTTESIVIKENSLYSPSDAEPIYLVESLPKITEESRAPNPYEEVEPLSKIPETTVHYDDVPVETDSDTASASLQLENPSRDQKNLPHNYEEVHLNIRNSDENQERSKSEKSHYYVLENPAECAHYKNLPK